MTEPLRRHLLDHPEDEAGLQVYADALFEAGDPLCALPGLGFEGWASELPGAVASRLLGPLCELDCRVEIVGGLLREVVLAEVSAEQLERLIGAPAWEGVRRVRLPSLGPEWGVPDLPPQAVLRLIGQPACRHVVELHDVSFAGFVQLCQLDRTFEVMSILELPAWRVDEVPALDPLRVRALRLCPERDEFRDEDQFVSQTLAWLQTYGRAIFDRLEVLVAPGDDACIPLLSRGAGAALRRVEASRWSATRDAEGWHAQVWHESAGALPYEELVRWQGIAQLHGLVARLAPLVRDFRLRVPLSPVEELRRFEVSARNKPVHFAPPHPGEAQVRAARGLPVLPLDAIVDADDMPW